MGRREDFAFVDLCRPGGSWPPFVLGRAPLTILQTCAWHDFAVRFCSFRVVAGAALRECVEIHCSGHIFRSPSVSHFRRLCSRERCSQMCTRVACRWLRNATVVFWAPRNIYKSCTLSVLWSYQVATGACLSSPGPPCGAICAFHFGQVKVSPLILRLGAAAAFPALFPRLGAVILQRAF